MSSLFPAGGACNASLYSLIKVMITIPFINNALSLSLSLDLALTDTRLRIRKKRRTERGREVTWLGIASALALSLSLSRARSLYKAGNVRCYDRGRERERERESEKKHLKSLLKTANTDWILTRLYVFFQTGFTDHYPLPRLEPLPHGSGSTHSGSASAHASSFVRGACLVAFFCAESSADITGATARAGGSWLPCLTSIT